MRYASKAVYRYIRKDGYIPFKIKSRSRIENIHIKRDYKVQTESDGKVLTCYNYLPLTKIEELSVSI